MSTSKERGKRADQLLGTLYLAAQPALLRKLEMQAREIMGQLKLIWPMTRPDSNSNSNSNSNSSSSSSTDDDIAVALAAAAAAAATAAASQPKGFKPKGFNKSECLFWDRRTEAWRSAAILDASGSIDASASVMSTKSNRSTRSNRSNRSNASSRSNKSRGVAAVQPSVTEKLAAPTMQLQQEKEKVLKHAAADSAAATAVDDGITEKAKLKRWYLALLKAHCATVEPAKLTLVATVKTGQSTATTIGAKDQVPGYRCMVEVTRARMRQVCMCVYTTIIICVLL
jgi:hypothetical protein